MHQRLSALLLVVALAATGLAGAWGCGGSPPASDGLPAATTSPHPTSTPSPPVSTDSPTLDLGGSAGFVLPDGSVVTVTVDQFDDPAAEEGATVGVGERLVSLKLAVRAEAPDGAAAATVSLPFKASSFLLVAADDSLYTPPEATAELFEGPWDSASSTGLALPFVVPDTAELVRFVCTPGGHVTPRSATWRLR